MLQLILSFFFYVHNVLYFVIMAYYTQYAQCRVNLIYMYHVRQSAGRVWAVDQRKYTWTYLRVFTRAYVRT